MDPLLGSYCILYNSSSVDRMSDVTLASSAVGESRSSSSSIVMWSVTYLALSIMLVIDKVYLFSS